MEKSIQNAYDNLLRRMNYNNQHVFINDYNGSLKIEKEETKNMKRKPLDYKKLENIESLKCVNEINKVLSLKEAKEIYYNYIKLNKQKDIENMLDKYVNYYLSGTTKDIKVEKDRKNILIVGGGPAGMFTALYLNKLYGYDKKISIQLIDTRIKEENIRLPFSRNRYFYVSTNYVFSLIYGFGCFSEDKEGIVMTIKHFELLLYCVCVQKGINMLFTQKYKTMENLNKILPKYDILIDCTGNRLDYQITKGIPKFDTIIHNDMIISQNGNEVEVNWKKISPIIHFLHVELLNKNYDSIPIKLEENNFFSLEKKEDIELLKKMKGCYAKKDAIKIISAIKDKKTRERINHMLRGNYVKLEYFELKQRHKILITDYIGKTLYIAAGDTAFYSHFYTGAGLSRMFGLIAHICHLLSLAWN
jgi:hypothetical protein